MAHDQGLSYEKRLLIYTLKQQNPTWGCKKIGDAAGVSKDAALKYMSTPPSPDGDSATSTPIETNEINGDKWTVSLPKTRICTLEQLVEHCQIDLSIWEVERFVANKWEMGFKNAADEADVIPLFQVKAFLKKKRAVVDARAELEALKSLAKELTYSPFTYKKKNGTTGKMLEVNIPDAHFGKLAWAEETGGRSYDTKIAAKDFMEAVEVLLSRVSVYEFDEIWFVVGNDMLNSDNKEGTTSGGTPVSNDTRYHKTFRTVRKCIVACIERFRPLVRVKVKVIFVSGNHDNMSVFHLGDSIECYFHDKDDVEIDNSPKKFKYHQFGKVMLMFTHGDKGKKDDYPLLMATQQPEMFGGTKFREAHCGHTHQTKVDEKHGIRVRVLPALCPPDDWHAENGLTGNEQSAEAFVWDKQEGLVTIAVHTVAGT